MTANKQDVNEVESCRTNNEKIAPDGGYGYVISVALCVNFICVYSHQNSFGMLFHDFLSETGDEAGSLTGIMASCMIMMSISGILVNVALKSYSVRQVALFGSFIYTAAWASNYFITKVYLLYITCGMVQGIAMAVLTTVTFTSFNSYFVEKRLTIISICQMIIGLVSMVFPLILERLMNIYGFRGTVLIMAGLFTHTILCALAFHPVEWHTKKKIIYQKVCQDADANMQSKEDEERNDSKMEMGEVNQPPSSKVNLTFWNRVSAQMDLSFLRDLIYLNVTLGMTVAGACDLIFCLLFPTYLYAVGFSTHQVATLLSVVAAADLVARALLAFISYFYKFRSRNIFFLSTIGAIVFKLFFLNCATYWPMIITSFVFGVFRGPMQVTMPIVYAEMYGDKFSAAYGLSFLFLGNANTILLPITGYIFKITQSFTITFYALNLCSAIFFIPWCYEYWCYKKKPIDGSQM